MWNAVTGLIEHTLQRNSQPVFSIAASPDGEKYHEFYFFGVKSYNLLGDYLATGSLGGHVSVWCIDNGSLVSCIVTLCCN